MQKKWLFAAIGISLAINVVLIFLLFKFDSYRKCCLTVKSSDEERGKYAYLAPRVFVENQNDILINFLPLRDALNEYVNRFNGKLGVYFEYLSSGNSIGVNDKIEVRLASLVKIPVVMAVYKQMEEGSMTRDQVLIVSEDDLNNEFGELWRKGAGASITVEEAIELSLLQSDNTAARALASALPEGAINNVFNSLDIRTSSQNGLPIISPKNYSSILRSLYLASYLSKKDSNEILNLLTKTHFNDKLPAGVLPEVQVAHKIGVFESEGVYSDCGIVYAPRRPYLLCVFSLADEVTSGERIKQVSKMVFGYISQVNR